MGLRGISLPCLFLVFLAFGVTYAHAAPSAVATPQPLLGFTPNPWGAPSQAHSPIIGQLSVIVIGVEFQDLRHQRPISDINQLVFKDLAQYWHDVSYGKVSLTGDVVGWVTAARPYSFYRAEDSPETRFSLILDAVNQADSQVDFRKYGYIMVVHAGQDQAYTGNKNDIWSSSSIGVGSLNTQDGQVSVGVTLLAEFDPLGPYVHEMGHNFGLPDLWNYAIVSSACKYCDNYVGEFDIMAHGFWADNGSTPVEPSVWSKIQLGWVSDSQVLTADKSILSMMNATLTPIETASGVKAVKYPLTDTTYYLVEVRHRIGWDRYLPDEGVIIYYVNTALSSGNGPVRIQPSKDVNRPAWNVGQTFMNLQDGVGVYVAARNNDFSFKIEYSIGLAASSFILTVKAPQAGLAVKVDENEYHTNADGQLILHESWGAHDVWVQDSIPISGTTRSAFAGWQDGVASNPRTLLLGSNLTVVAQYKLQYLLNVSSLFPVEGDGWHDANATIAVTVPSTVDHGNGTRHVFVGWSGDASGVGNLTVSMNGPKSIITNWKQQFLLEVESSYGTPTGAGWYDMGSIAVVIIQPIIQTRVGEREVFAGWSGSIANSSPNMTLQLMSPMRVFANWKTQHLVQVVVLDAHGTSVVTPQPQVEFTNGIVMLVGGERVWLDSGSYVVSTVAWYGIEVYSGQLPFATSPNAVWKIPTEVYSVRITVRGLLTGLAANGAVATISLPNGATMSAPVKNGVAFFAQVPSGKHGVIVSAGPLTNTGQLDVLRDMDVSLPVLLPIELLAAVGAPFMGIVGVFSLRWRWRKQA